MSSIDRKDISQWIRNQISSQNIPHFNPALWISDIHNKAIADFTNNPEAKKLVVYIDSLDGKLYFQSDLPKYHNGEYVYIMKRENTTTNNLSDKFVIGKIKGDDPIESLYHFMTGQKLSTLIEQSKWPEGNTIDITTYSM